MDRNYNLNELAMITGFTTRTLRTYLSKGLLKGTKIDGVWQFSEAEIDQFLSEPFVKEGLRIKRNAVVFDFLADAGRKTGRACVILDLPVSLVENQKVSTFFCDQMCKAEDAVFCAGVDHGAFRVILSGADAQVKKIMKAYDESFGKGADA